MRRLLCACALLAALSVPLAAETLQVTKVGIIDFTKVLLTAYKDTKGFRDYDQAQADYDKEVKARTKEILDLQSQKLDADKAKNTTLSLSLEKTIADKQKDLTTYMTVKGQVLNQQKAALLTNTVYGEILDVVKNVAENNGFSLVLRKDVAPSLFLYNIAEVDITQLVIDAIMARKAAG
jgi:Skp family chaperone for outer membrane proteins